MMKHWLVAATAAVLVGSLPSAAGAQSTPAKKPFFLAKQSLTPMLAVGQGEKKEEEKAPPEITYGASVDFYFSHNFNDPWNGKNSLRAFDLQDDQGPHLGLIDIWAQGARSSESLGWRVDLNWGPTARLVNAFEPTNDDVWEHIEQAYLSANLTKDGKTYVDFGKWVTTAGAEVIEPKDNWLYTRGLLFTWAIPFYHMGARLYHYTNDTDYGMIGVTRGWNAVSSPGHDPGIVLAGSKVLNKQWTGIVNYYGGDEFIGANDSWRNLVDVIALYNPTEKTSYVFNFDYGQQGSDKWYGLSAMGKRAMGANGYAAARLEWLTDEDGVVFGDDCNALSFTLGYTRVWNKWAQTKIEYRHDLVGGANLITDERRGTLTDDQGTFTISTIFSY